MELNIGNRIKELRRERKMTQERLAELVGISAQAVSKWETNIGLPDITVVPKIAQIFGVTTDDLFGYNLREQKAEIDDCLAKSWQLRESDPKEARRILEEALAKYPESDILWNNLLYVLPYREDPDETIRIAGELIDRTRESDIKYDALRFLAYAYDAKGDKDSAVAALEQIPEIYFTKLSELAYVQTGKAKFDAADKQKWISFEILIQMMWKIAECYEADGEINSAIAETEKALAAIAAMGDDEIARRFSNYAEYFTSQIDRMRGGK